MTSMYKIKDLPILSIETATGKARGLLETAKRQLGFVPNMYGAMVNEPALFESYATTYALFRAECVSCRMWLHARGTGGYLTGDQPRKHL
jgi:hypothetical protein